MVSYSNLLIVQCIPITKFRLNYSVLSQDWNMLYFNTLNANFDRLERALSLVDFSKQYKMGSIGSRLLDKVHKFIKDHKLDVKIIPGMKWLRMPQAEASKIVVKYI